MKLQEKVLCVGTDLLRRQIGLQKNVYMYDEQGVLQVFSSCEPQFITRSDAEQDPSYKQLIPYCLIQDRDNDLLCYQRRGTEKRLHGLFSLGVGGHINPEDASATSGFSLARTLRRALEREVSEETGFVPPEQSYTCKGLIYEDASPVGTVHIGIVYLVSVDRNQIRAGEELGQIRWISLTDTAQAMQNKSMQFEHWSELAFQLCSSEAYE